MAALFDDNELELINAAKAILSDGMTRLKNRGSLFAHNRMTKPEREQCRNFRSVITDKLCADYAELRYEVAVAVLIDAQGRLIDIARFPTGKATQCEVSCRVLAGMIVTTGATAVVLAHNHPSGDNTPSSRDVTLTTQLRVWLSAMEVQLIDHLVLSGEGAASIIGEWLS